MQVGVLAKIGIGAQTTTKADRISNLVARCREGDPDAFRQIYEEFIPGVHRHLSVLIGPGADIDDLIQLVFLNVFNSIRRFRGHSAFSTWLFRITVNVARQEIRSRGRRRKMAQAAFDVSEIRPKGTDRTPENSLLVQQQIYEVLDTLPPKKRETFILYMYEGYSLEEIATLIGSTVSTVGSRLQSARKEIVRSLAARRSR